MTIIKNVFGALSALVAMWIAPTIFPPQGMAGVLFAMIFTVVICVTAIILNVKPEPFTSIRRS